MQYCVNGFVRWVVCDQRHDVGVGAALVVGHFAVVIGAAGTSRVLGSFAIINSGSLQRHTGIASQSSTHSNVDKVVVAWGTNEIVHVLSIGPGDSDDGFAPAANNSRGMANVVTQVSCPRIDVALI